MIASAVFQITTSHIIRHQKKFRWNKQSSTARIDTTMKNRISICTYYIFGYRATCVFSYATYITQCHPFKKKIIDF